VQLLLLDPGALMQRRGLHTREIEQNDLRSFYIKNYFSPGDQIMPVGNAANRDAAYDAAARADDVASRGELQRAVQLMERACALLPNVRIPPRWRERSFIT
jgi:hypothetical protein